MAKQPVLTLLGAGVQYDSATLTANFTAIQTQFDNTVSRDGSAPNFMLGDLDMNSYDILNVGDIDVGSLTIDGVDVTNVINNPLNGLVPNDGDLLFWNNGQWNLLGVGGEGEVLKSISGLPNWEPDIDTDTIGITVQEDGSTVQTTVTILNFITDGANIVSSPSAGRVEVDLDTFIANA